MPLHSVVIIEEDLSLASMHLQRINAVDGYVCTQIFTNFNEFLESKSRPDVIIVDITMHGMSGLTTLPLILKKFPNSSVIVSSGKEDHETIVRAISIGAVAYIDKSSFLDTIEDGLKEIKNNGAYITPKIAKRIFEYFHNPNSSQDILTQRELQIAHLINDAMSYKQVAEKCGISVDTVRMHIRNIYRKLNVHSKIQLANLLSNRSKYDLSIN